MSDWTLEYVPDAANVVGGLTQAQIDQVESLASWIADAVAVRRIGTPLDVTEAVSNVKRRAGTGARPRGRAAAKIVTDGLADTGRPCGTGRSSRPQAATGPDLTRPCAFRESRRKLTEPPLRAALGAGFDLLGCSTPGLQAVILQGMDTADSRGASGARYQRPYAVAERLDLLRGPSSGAVQLPSHLDWSGNAVYDLDAPGRVVDLYRAVLIEAASPQDLYAYLDEGVLRRLWALLWLPAQLRSAWEQRFPVLAEISRITAAA